jgi:hypothetical protein
LTFGDPEPPPPPPSDVIVEKTEFEPLTPTTLSVFDPVPPPPTVIV